MYFQLIQVVGGIQDMGWKFPFLCWLSVADIPHLTKVVHIFVHSAPPF
jgi:hypothetical protein